MRQQHTLNFFIKLIFVLVLCHSTYAQSEKSNKKQTKEDKPKEYKQKYGLRIGTDLSKIIRSHFDHDFNGLELLGDYRITQSWYIAGEIGSEKKTTNTDNLEVETTGNYFKAGADYNFFDNWFGMENMIYSGFRIGASTFNHERKQFSTYNVNPYWPVQFENNTPKEFKGLSAVWLEFIMGIKAELLNNLYLGVNVQLKRSVSQNKPDNFDNLYISGFNRTYGGSKFGVGYGYNISYLIPLYKKSKKKTKEEGN